MQMLEKTVPWWRKALIYALGGIRSRFGLFPRTAQPVPLNEQRFAEGLEPSLGVETALTDYAANPETIAAEAVRAAESAPAPMAESDDAIELMTVAAAAPVVESASTPAPEDAIPPVPVPIPVSVQETAPQPVPTPEAAPQQEPEKEPAVEAVTIAEPTPAAEPSPVAEPVPAAEPVTEPIDLIDPIPEQR